MGHVEFRTPQGQRRYDDLADAAAESVVCLDFDGVLAPIVEDPARAFIHERAHEVLDRVLRRFRAVAVVTGRPADQAVELGRLDQLADETAAGILLVRGQYGNERWDSRTRATERPAPPDGLTELRDSLPDLLAEARADATYLEDKGLALALHTRRLPDPGPALERLVRVLETPAAEHGLVLEPGRFVVELRAPGMDKGQAVRTLHDELAPAGMLFAGDDLGDVAAFEAVRALREDGMTGLLVCSGSEEQQALVELADVVVDGPDGVLAFLGRLAEDSTAR